VREQFCHQFTQLVVGVGAAPVITSPACGGLAMLFEGPVAAAAGVAA
jgi:hypothetical protein